MLNRLLSTYQDLDRRIRDIDRRGLLDPRDWLMGYDRVRYATAFVFVSLLIAVITFLSNITQFLSFLLFPPLAAAAFQLFAHPGEQSSPPRGIVLGLTSGALGGWVAVLVAEPLFGPPPEGTFIVSIPAAVMSVVFTSVLLWVLDIDLAPAFAVALLVILLDIPPGLYVLNVAGASTLVAGTFLIWHRAVYDRRAEQLYAVPQAAATSWSRSGPTTATWRGSARESPPVTSRVNCWWQSFSTKRRIERPV